MCWGPETNQASALPKLGQMDLSPRTLRAAAGMCRDSRIPEQGTNLHGRSGVRDFLKELIFEEKVEIC